MDNPAETPPQRPIKAQLRATNSTPGVKASPYTMNSDNVIFIGNTRMAFPKWR